MQECVKKLEKGEANGQYDHTCGAQWTVNTVLTNGNRKFKNELCKRKLTLKIII